MEFPTLDAWRGRRISYSFPIAFAVLFGGGGGKTTLIAHPNVALWRLDLHVLLAALQRCMLRTPIESYLHVVWSSRYVEVEFSFCQLEGRANEPNQEASVSPKMFLV